MAHNKKVMIFGAAGRVGLGLVSELLRHNIDIAAVDNIDGALLGQKLARVLIDSRISRNPVGSALSCYGNVDVLNQSAVTDLLAKERPDVVVNYAIPFTWDAAKKLDNYPEISRAGLGAFSAIQVLAPRVIARSLALSGISALFIVGNLPDITVPIICGTGTHLELVEPICGAGNVGLIEAGLRHQIAIERSLRAEDLRISLVAHHIHWVAPREPGYRNDAPFLLKVFQGEDDVTSQLGDQRELMNRSIVNGYEPGAGFSSTTARLAAENIIALLGSQPCRLHVPSPNGLPGGYPVIVKNGVITLDLPAEWPEIQAVETMQQAHKCDGIDKIGADGSIYFNPESVDIIRKEMGFSLPLVVSPTDLDSVAREQIAAARRSISSL